MEFKKEGAVMEYVRCNLCNSDCTKTIMKVSGFNVVRCKNCSLAYVNPRLKEKRLHRIYNKGYFKNPAFKGAKSSFYGYSKYIEEKDCIRSTFKRRLRVIDHLSKKGKLLDIGCAYGFFLELAKEDGWDANGLEISKHAYSYARNKLKLRVKNMPLENAKIKSNSFDVVTLFDVIEHVPDPQSMIKEIKRIVRPNGLVVITTPNIGTFAAKVLGDKWEEVRRVREHIYFFSGKTLKSMLERNGFQILRTESAGRYFHVKSAIERGKFYSKPIFNILERISNGLDLNKKKIWVNPFYKITVYARKTE